MSAHRAVAERARKELGIPSLIQDFPYPLDARVKILDACSHGLPLISTHLGAEGLDLQNGANLLLADAPDALTEAAMPVLLEPALAARLRGGTRRTVEARSDWRGVYKAWDRVCSVAEDVGETVACPRRSLEAGA